MTVTEFVERYYLHDSSLEKVEFDVDKKILALTIEFCFWQQFWYDKSTPTNGLIRVTFGGVSRFEYDDCIAEKIFSDIDSEIRDGILDADENFFLVAVEYADFDEQDDIYFSLKINAATVDVEELTRYNL